MLRLALTPRWLGTLLLVLVLATAFVGLSVWQANRAEHKNDATVHQGASRLKDFNDVVEAEVPTPARVAYQRVRLSGKFLPKDQVVVADKYASHHKGYWVVTMFVPDGAKLGVHAHGDDDKPIAIPVVRGFSDDKKVAQSSRAPGGTTQLDARLNPIDAPINSSRADAGTVGSISTAQLVNLFDVYSYSASLFVDADQQSKVAGSDLSHVKIDEPQSGGFDLQSGVYAIEWLFFAGFALYMWWRLLRDEYEGKRRAGAYRAALSAAPGDGAGGHGYVVVKAAGEHELRDPATVRHDIGNRTTPGSAAASAGTERGDVDNDSTEQEE